MVSVCLAAIRFLLAWAAATWEGPAIIEWRLTTYQGRKERRFTRILAYLRFLPTYLADRK